MRINITGKGPVFPPSDEYLNPLSPSVSGREPHLRVKIRCTNAKHSSVLIDVQCHERVVVRLAHSILLL